MFYPLIHGAEKETAFIEYNKEKIEKLSEMIAKWNKTSTGRTVEKEIEFIEEFLKIANLSLPKNFKSEKMVEKIKWLKNQKFAHLPTLNLGVSETKFQKLSEIENFINENFSDLPQEEKQFVQSVKVAVQMNGKAPVDDFLLPFIKENGKSSQIYTKDLKLNLFSNFFFLSEDNDQGFETFFFFNFFFIFIFCFIFYFIFLFYFYFFYFYFYFYFIFLNKKQRKKKVQQSK